MLTQSQIDANRRNAQCSTGPRTVEGKAISSMNALKSGIDAQSSVIPGEDAAALAVLTERLYQGCQPQTDIECLLVDDIVRDTWLLTRLARVDAQILIYIMEDTNYPCPNAPAGKSFHQSSSTQSRLQRRINDTRRLRLQSIKELQRLQAARPQPPAPQPASQRAHIESLTSPTGFVPQASRMHSTPEVPPLFPTPENHVSGIDASAPVGASPIGETP